jgi:uncharacterized protein YijF (DUF1287 family)
MRKIILLVIFGLILSFVLVFMNNKKPVIVQKTLGPSVEVPDISSVFGKEIVAKARLQIGVVTKYDTSYFNNAEVPEDSGVCADVVWRALAKIGYNLREELDKDIQNNPQNYPNVKRRDSAIDFRRVKNLNMFFDQYAENLTKEVVPGNIENLSTWQAGDLVTFSTLPGSGLTHIAIISDKRRTDGVPLMIHNYGHGTLEDDYLLNWPTKITGHYRLESILSFLNIKK